MDGDVYRGQSKLNFRVMLSALAVSIILMAMKFLAYWLTGSTAILSDALESIINVVAGGFALGSVVLASKPPDEDHPYGHGKIEYFSAGFEGALIIIAAIGIFYEGVTQIISPRDLPKLDLGLLLLVLSAVINGLLAYILIRTGRKTGSLVLLADGKHILTDVYTSGVVLVGLILVGISGWYRLDGIVACLAGMNIVFSGAQLIKQAFVRLMDSSDPKLLNEICTILSNNRREIWIDVHRLRAWRSGNRVHTDFHLILPRDMALEDVHKEVKFLEGVFNQHFGNQADILIHLDPCLDPECPVCQNDPCDLRKPGQASLKDWNPNGLTNIRNPKLT